MNANRLRQLILASLFALYFCECRAYGQNSYVSIQPHAADVGVRAVRAKLSQYVPIHIASNYALYYGAQYGDGGWDLYWISKNTPIRLAGWKDRLPIMCCESPVVEDGRIIICVPMGGHTDIFMVHEEEPKMVYIDSLPIEQLIHCVWDEKDVLRLIGQSRHIKYDVNTNNVLSEYKNNFPGHLVQCSDSSDATYGLVFTHEQEYVLYRLGERADSTRALSPYKFVGQMVAVRSRGDICILRSEAAGGDKEQHGELAWYVDVFVNDRCVRTIPLDVSGSTVPDIHMLDTDEVFEIVCRLDEGVCQRILITEDDPVVHKSVIKIPAAFVRYMHIVGNRYVTALNSDVGALFYWSIVSENG